MHKNDKLLQAICNNEFSSFLEEGQTVTKESIGELVLPTGKIVGCDPLSLVDTIAFEKSVEPGKYPVDIFVLEIETDKRVAFAKITFNDEVAEEFEMALIEGEDLAEVEEDEFFGYGIDSGTGAFTDQATATALNDLIGEDEDSYEALETMLDENYVDTYSSANVTIPNSDDNIVAFSSGYGDGAYPSYFGLTKSGTITCLITDFLCID